MVGVFDSSTDTLRRRLTGPSLVTGVALSAGRPLAVGTDGTLRVWSADARQLRTGGRAFYQLASDAQGSDWLAAAVPGEDRVELWKLDGDIPRVSSAPLPDNLKIFSAVYVSPSGDTLMAGTTTGQVVVWPLTPAGPGAPAVHQVFPTTSRISSLAVNTSGTLAAATEYTGAHTAVYSIDAGQWRLTAQLDTPAPQVVQFNPAGTLLEVGLGLNTVQLWSVETPSAPRLRGSFDVGSTPPDLAVVPDLGTDRRRCRLGRGERLGRQRPELTETAAGLHRTAVRHLRASLQP